jgi:putative endonuclease
MFYVYVLKSLKRNYIYVGLTNSVDRRFNEHQTEKNKTTKPYSPFKIILIEQFELRSGARKREKYLKSGIGKQYLKALH